VISARLLRVWPGLRLTKGNATLVAAAASVLSLVLNAMLARGQERRTRNDN
jgi:hypothetical protein